MKAFKPEMKVKDYELYRGIYCSLCRALGRNYSPVAQLFLSYDFAFAAVLRLAAAASGCSFSQKRCPYNPAKKCMNCSDTQALDFCAHAMIITVYYKVLDNLHDSGFASKILAAMIYPIIKLMHKKAVRLAPEIDEIIGQSMKMQAETEMKSGVGIDEAAHPSADALGKVVAFGFDGKTKDALYSLGYMVGRFVYILDAADDLEDDLRRGNFNPFKGESEQTERIVFAEKVRGMLNLTQSGALDALDSLGAKRFGDILENIILDGLTFSAEKMLKKYLPESEDKKVYKVD